MFLGVGTYNVYLIFLYRCANLQWLTVPTSHAIASFLFAYSDVRIFEKKVAVPVDLTSVDYLCETTCNERFKHAYVHETGQKHRRTSTHLTITASIADENVAGPFVLSDVEKWTLLSQDTNPANPE